MSCPGTPKRGRVPTIFLAAARAKRQRCFEPHISITPATAMPSYDARWNGFWRPIPKRPISWPGPPSEALGTAQSTAELHPRGSRPDPDSTCDLDSTGAVSTNGPSTSPAPDRDSTCDLNPSGAVSTNGPSTTPASNFEVTGEFNRDLTASKRRNPAKITTGRRLQGRLPSTEPDLGAATRFV